MPPYFCPDPETIRWRLHLHSRPEAVFDFLATDEGRRRFWAEETRESGDTIFWVFAGGLEGPMKVYEKVRPTRFVCEYLSDSKVTFELESDGKGGTDLTMTHTGVPAGEMIETIAGWGSVLMSLKGAADYSADLRNHDPVRTWEKGFFDN